MLLLLSLGSQHHMTSDHLLLLPVMWPDYSTEGISGICSWGDEWGRINWKTWFLVIVWYPDTERRLAITRQWLTHNHSRFRQGSERIPETPCWFCKTFFIIFHFHISFFKVIRYWYSASFKSVWVHVVCWSYSLELLPCKYTVIIYPQPGPLQRHGVQWDICLPDTTVTFTPSCCLFTVVHMVRKENWGRKWPAVCSRDSLLVGPTQSSHPSKNVTCHSFKRVFKETTVLLFWIRLALGQQDTGVSVWVSLGATAIVDGPFGFPLSSELSF